MIMWIAAIVLVALSVSLGYREGATRAAIMFVGLLIAACLAVPMAPLFNFIFKFIHVHPAVPQFVTPLIAFVAVAVVFAIIGSFVFKKVDYHYRYNVSDAHRAFWERMHRRVGAGIGALNGLIYFFIFALFIDAAGYVTIQTGGDESGSKVLWFITRAAQDLRDTHMDKVVGPFNPAPEKYYEVSDLLGTLYHNRALKGRVEEYPVFAAMADRPLFHDMASDAAFQKALDSGTLEDLLENGKFQEAVTNAALYDEFTSVDLGDLKQYLETGVSPKFADQPILGRWAYDPNASIELNRALHRDIGASGWVRLRKELSERFRGALLSTFFNNKAVLKLSAATEGKASPMRPVSVVRFQTNYAALWYFTNASYSATGKWSGASPAYLITLGNKNGTATSEAKLEGKRLSFKFEEKEIAFDKLPD